MPTSIRPLTAVAAETVSAKSSKAGYSAAITGAATAKSSKAGSNIAGTPSPGGCICTPQMTYTVEVPYNCDGVAEGEPKCYYEVDGRRKDVDCSEIVERSRSQIDPANIVLGKSSKSASINTAALTTSGKSGKSFVSTSSTTAAIAPERSREHAVTTTSST